MIRLRPHHGMCLAYFEGKGYSDGFTGNMQHMLELLEKGADVEMAVFGDEICKACPNLKHGVCLSADLVEHYDRKVLEYCGLKERENLSFRDLWITFRRTLSRPGNVWKSVAAVSGMRYAAGKKADGNKYEIRNVPYSQSTVWHVFCTALACSKCLRSV